MSLISSNDLRLKRAPLKMQSSPKCRTEVGMKCGFVEMPYDVTYLYDESFFVASHNVYYVKYRILAERLILPISSLLTADTWFETSGHLV